MATRTLTGTYPSGYTLSSNYSTLSIASTGLVEGSGVYSSHLATVANLGAVKEASGPGTVLLADGGSVINGSASDTSSLLSGSDVAVLGGTAGTVINYGTIAVASAAVIPAAVIISNDTDELKANVTNFGVITGADLGVSTYGGVVVNGGPGHTAALITGGTGVQVDNASVSNFGTITGTGIGTPPGANPTLFSYAGVYLIEGASLTNGSATSLGAYISGYTGVSAQGSTSSVVNFGTIASTGGGSFEGEPGVYLDGGALQNGAGASKYHGLPIADDTTALIEGYDGVEVTAGGSVTNLGTILGTSGVDGFYGALFTDGGRLTNGSTSDHAALVNGYDGVMIRGAAGTVFNYGTVSLRGLVKQLGVSLAAGGYVTNGSTSDDTATILGNYGVGIASKGEVVNFGSIEGLNTAGYGVKLAEGGSIVNGSAGDTAALIKGYQGVALYGLGTLTNFGAIEGTGKTAVSFNSSAETLVVEAGSVFDGAVDGDLGTLDLASGTGTISGLFAGGDVTVSASMPTTTFDDFGIIEIGAGASFTLTGTDAIAAGQSLIDNGTLTVTGALTSSGTLGGTGTADFTAGANALTGGTLSVADLDVTGGTVTLSGTIAVPDVMSVSRKLGTSYATSGHLLVGAGGATLTGAGALLFQGTNELITGVSTTSVLTNDTRLEGDGELGDGSMELVNNENIYSLSSTPLVIDTGSETILNAGVIASEGSGGLTISSPIDNTGELLAYSSPLTVSGAVTGAGKVDADAGEQADFSGTGSVFSGTLTGAGAVDFTAGTDALTGATLSVADLNVTGATVTLSGKIAVPGVMTVSGKLLVANGTSLTGGGAIVLTDSASNEITGTTATSLLTSDMRIEGEGQLGDGAMELTNAASGSIYSLGAGSLTVNPGTSTILNAGAIVSEGTGGLTISSPIDNTGELLAYSSPLTVSGAVTGAGTAEIENAGTLILKGAFNENVTFASGSTGTLELGDSKGYTTGAITGFSKTGANALDLLDIPFVSGTTTATYSGTTASGVLTVKDGANVATIHLEGNYTTSTFTVSAGPGGVGTKVVDPTQPSAPPKVAAVLPIADAGGGARFVAAMAAFAAPTAAEAIAPITEPWRETAPMLAHAS